MFLAAGFLQTAGLYLGTACYVRWMDVLSARQGPQAAAGGAGPSPAPEGRPWPALDDPLAGGHVLSWAEASGAQGPWGAEFWLGVLTGAVPVVWLGVVVHSQNLQPWAKVLISGALLAAVNGFSAWATMVPDPSGWEACKERLGPGGLMNYRVFAAGSNQGGEQADPAQIVTDLLMLEVRGLWLMGRQSRHYTCVGTMFSATSCYCVLFALGLYDAVRSLSLQIEEARRAAVLSVTGFSLVLVVGIDALFSIVNGYCYTVEIVVAVVLTTLVYGSPVVAAAATNWAGDEGPETTRPLEARPGHSTQQPRLPMPIGRTEVSSDTMASMDLAGNVVGPLADVAEVTVAPCCVPFCSLGGLYYLREAPGAAMGRPWTAEAAQAHLQQQSVHSRQREKLLEQLQQQKAELEYEHLRARERETQRAEAERLHREELAQRLAEEERGALEEAASLLEGARSRRANLAQRAEGAAESLRSLEAELAESRLALLRSHDEANGRTAQALEGAACLAAEAADAERQLAILAEALGPAEAEKLQLPPDATKAEDEPPPGGDGVSPGPPEPEKPEPQEPTIDSA